MWPRDGSWDILRSRFKLRLNLSRHVPKALKILPRPPVRKYVEKRRNIAVLESQSNINAMSLNCCTAKSRHQNTDVSTHEINDSALVTIG